MSVHIVVAHQIEPLTYPYKLSKRVFILGPSHHVYIDGCALSKCVEYATPLGALPLDRSSTLLLYVSLQCYEPFCSY